MDSAVATYMRQGGKIDRLPSVSSKKDRAIINKNRKPRKQPKKPQDELCTALECPNIPTCTALCPPLTWIDGNKETVEKIMNDPDNDHCEFRDYNLTLSQLMKERDPGIEQIRQIENVRLRAIAAMIYANLSVGQMSAITGLSERHIKRICMSPPKQPLS
jgi:hypothetical protein